MGKRKYSYTAIYLDGSKTVGMTNWLTRTIYLSSILSGPYLERVLCHELCHCFCFSYGIYINIQQEEFLANWVSIYGRDVIELLDALLSGHKMVTNL